MPVSPLVALFSNFILNMQLTYFSKLPKYSVHATVFQLRIGCNMRGRVRKMHIVHTHRSIYPNNFLYPTYTRKHYMHWLYVGHQLWVRKLPVFGYLTCQRLNRLLANSQYIRCDHILRLTRSQPVILSSW